MRLILIRHAKSNWDDPFQDDHARMLNKRGRDAARAIGTWLQAKGHDQIMFWFPTRRVRLKPPN